jgi:hypothetical protein
MDKDWVEECDVHLLKIAEMLDEHGYTEDVCESINELHRKFQKEIDA